MRAFFPVFFLWVLAAGWLGGQSLAWEKLPPAPPSGLSDVGGVLGQNSERQRRVEGLIADLERERGYRLFVVIERSLISSNARDMAARMQKEWLPDGGGLVAVYETDTRKMGIGYDLDPGEGIRREEIGVPAYELLRILEEAAKQAKAHFEQPEVYMETWVEAVCGGIDGYFAKKQAPVDGGRSLRLALVTVGALSLLALCGLGISWLRGKADTQRVDTREFPRIDVPERLGAPYGGGGGGSDFFGRSRKEIR